MGTMSMFGNTETPNYHKVHSTLPHVILDAVYIVYVSSYIISMAQCKTVINDVH